MSHSVHDITRLVDRADAKLIASSEFAEDILYEQELMENVELAVDAEEVTFEDD